MTLEEIAQACKQMKTHTSDCEDSDFAREYMPKLIAIAQTALKLKIACVSDPQISGRIIRLTGEIFDLLTEIDPSYSREVLKRQ